MVRTNNQHFGNSKIVPANTIRTLSDKVSGVNGIDSQTKGVSLSRSGEAGTAKPSFQDYLMEALNTVNSQQIGVSKIQEQLITDPDSVDVHDVTIAMSKARLSMNLAQTVIDRLVSGWNEITTTR